jgi:hypothetical protein
MLDLKKKQREKEENKNVLQTVCLFLWKKKKMLTPIALHRDEKKREQNASSSTVLVSFLFSTVSSIFSSISVKTNKAALFFNRDSFKLRRERKLLLIFLRFILYFKRIVQ